MRDAPKLALALQASERHQPTADGACAHCLPYETPWPCLPYRLAVATAQRLGADFPSAPIHPDWLDGQ